VADPLSRMRRVSNLLTRSMVRAHKDLGAPKALRNSRPDEQPEQPTLGYRKEEYTTTDQSTAPEVQTTSRDIIDVIRSRYSTDPVFSRTYRKRKGCALALKGIW